MGNAIIGFWPMLDIWKRLGSFRGIFDKSE